MFDTEVTENGLAKLWLGFRDEDTGLPTDANPIQQKAIDLYFKKHIQYLLLDGGTRAGKTSCAIQIAVQQMVKTPGIHILLGHVDLPGLEGSLIYHLLKQIPEFVQITESKKIRILERNNNRQQIVVRIPGLINPARGYTAKIDYRPLDPGKRLHERLAISGAQYGLAILDQIENLSEDVFTKVIPRMSQEPRKIICTANPDPNQWFYRVWIERKGLNNEGPKKFGRVMMIPIDNKYLSGEYVKAMEESMPEALRDRYIRGLYVPVSGLVIPDENFTYVDNVIDVPYPIPAHWDIYEAMDYGYTDPWITQWWGVDHENNCVMIDSLMLQECGPEDGAAAILTMRDEIIKRDRTGVTKPRFVMTIGDPSMGNTSWQGNNIVKALSEYEHPNGTRLHVMPATRKQLADMKKIKKDTLKIQQVSMLNEQFKKRKIFIGRNNTRWFNQRAVWTWDKKKETPASWRSYGPNKKVIHHFDEMDATLYFLWHHSLNPEPEIREHVLPDGADYFVNRDSNISDCGPLNRFRVRRNDY